MKRLLPVLLLLLLLAPASGTVIRRVSLAEVEGYAEQIFAGTVRQMRAIENPPPGNAIETEVTFGDLVVLKGHLPRATVSYCFAGGTVGDRTLVVVGMPRFEIGARYVLFAAPSIDPLCPAVGWWQGRYVVVPAAGGGEPTIADSDGRPVYGFDRGFPLLSPSREEPRPLELPAFLALVRGLTGDREKREQEEKR
jgi:hypothetical protein